MAQRQRCRYLWMSKNSHGYASLVQPHGQDDVAPPVLGIALTLATPGYQQQSLTLFRWMAMMLVLGLGANHAVFLDEGTPYPNENLAAMYASLLLSAVTALLSFGLLSRYSMPARCNFGLTLLLGIAFIAVLVPASLRVDDKVSR